ncbi:MAG TPA: 30S ribosomal protein S8 [Patescibacteria group bacterium]|nr:30S ribosomal protein S8 [Patescibacteria group bacterium]
MLNDPISDMLTRIRNAGLATHASVQVPYSKLKESLAKLLEAEGFISKVSVSGEGKDKKLELGLKYDSSGAPAISGLVRVSKPGQRIYLGSSRIPRTNGGFGVTVISTSKGLMSDKAARREKHGGEVLFQVW